MAAHSSVLAWEISQTEEPGGLQSMGSRKKKKEKKKKRSLASLQHKSQQIQQEKMQTYQRKIFLKSEGKPESAKLLP